MAKIHAKDTFSQQANRLAQNTDAKIKSAPKKVASTAIAQESKNPKFDMQRPIPVRDTYTGVEPMSRKDRLNETMQPKLRESASNPTHATNCETVNRCAKHFH